MEELISRIVEKVGIAPDVAERVVGIILGLFQSEAGEGPLKNLVAAMPEAGALIERAQQAVEAPQAAAGGIGGLLGGGGGGLGGLLGGALGAMAGGNPLTEALGKLNAEGLSIDQAKAAGSEVVSFARERAGDDVVDQLLAAVPGLRSVL